MCVARRPDGALEHDVLRVLWSADGPLLPGEITARLDADYAYTSIATILTRLLAKGLVVRSSAGRAFAYSAVVDEPELAVRRIAEVLDASSDRSQVLSRLIGGLSARETTAIKTMLDQALAKDGDR
jgi:predicted transcriptional regulator